MEGGLVIGTGDGTGAGLATYNGDQMSMYGINASVPKTLVRHLSEVGRRDGTGRRDARHAARNIDTPVSPELLGRRRGQNRPGRPVTSWGLTNSMASSSTTSSARVLVRRKSCCWPNRPSTEITTAPRFSGVAHGLRPRVSSPSNSNVPGHARRPESRLGDALAPRRLAHALRRLGSGMAARTRHVIT